jgi:hypothetical protein
MRNERTKLNAIITLLLVLITFLIVGWIVEKASANNIVCLGNKNSGGISVKPACGEKPKLKPKDFKARLINGKAIAPIIAPKRVKKAIKAANQIRNKPYLWGGGHSSFRSSGYDCSGAVSYALRGGNFLKSPLASGPLMNWGKNGKGKWITVYANSGHTFVIIAGLRFDTSGTGGSGPRWQAAHTPLNGFVARHPTGF